jgi:DNA-directed RNA polymerase subunit K/omega
MKILYSWRGCERKMTLLTAEEKELLARAASLMDELLETLEVVQDKKLVKDLKIALREVEEGKTRPLDELIRELNLENEI